MGFKEFVNGNRKIFIVIGLIIIAYIIYRYFWEKKSIVHDLSFKKTKNQIMGIEKDGHFEGKKEMDTRTCLDKNVQERIADEITKKLNQIDACDCSGACEIGADKTTNSIKNNQLSKHNIVEVYGNYNFY